MLRHYIKMAMRHLLKNKIQNLISIVGLSVGILCFSICLYCSRFISEVDSCFSNKELIADINLCTTRGDLYSGIPATTIEELRKLRFDEVQDFTFTVYPRERSYNVEIKEGKELPYDHLMTMEVDSLFRKVFTPRILQGSWEVGLSGNFWLVSFKISYLCLPLFYETRTTPSCHPSGCAYRQL